MYLSKRTRHTNKKRKKHFMAKKEYAEKVVENKKQEIEKIRKQRKEIFDKIEKRERVETKEYIPKIKSRATVLRFDSN